METRIVDRPFSDFREGETASLTREVTSQDIETFCRLSGDCNPLHVDPDYSRSSGFRGVLAHGLLVAAPVSQLAGHLLPGRRCLLLVVEAEFVAPVYIGDRLTYKAVIVKLSPGLRTMKVEWRATNQQNELVLRGRYRAQVGE